MASRAFHALLVSGASLVFLVSRAFLVLLVSRASNVLFVSRAFNVLLVSHVGCKLNTFGLKLVASAALTLWFQLAG